MAQYVKTAQIICGICFHIQQWFHQKTIMILSLFFNILEEDNIAIIRKAGINYI